jgi:hypothetical protein
MPKQLYLPAFSKSNYAIGALTLKDRPDFCMAIGKCIAVWTYVDNEMGNLFSLLLGTESDAALEVFLSLRQFRHQREALEAAAKHSLSGHDLTAFQALTSVYCSLDSQRNDLAHGCFGICPDDPSLLLWIDVKHHVHFQTETLSKEARGHFSEDRHARLKENLYVYRKQDLENLYAEMEEFWWAVFYLNGYLREPTNSGRIAEFRKLCTFPKIKQEISRLLTKSAAKSCCD